MPSVFKLAYVELGTASLDAAVAYYSNVLGVTEIGRDGGVAYLGLGLDHHSVSLAQGDVAIGAIGLQLDRAVSLEDVSRRLADLGMDPHIKHDARPGVPVLLEVSDVGGHRFHLFHDIAMTGPGFAGRGIAPIRLGHVAVLSSNAPQLLAFLTDGLGFWTTDWFEDRVTFVTCNRDHHVMNIIDAPIATLHHLAFQLNDRAHHFAAADFLTERRIPTVWGPARHTAGHNVASYHYGADGALIELFSDMDVFVPEAGYCEPRPWHGDRPQAPKHWPLAEMTRWDTKYEFDMSAVAFGMSGR